MSSSGPGHDNCNYYDEEGNLLGNWATEWQDTHTEDTDWYDCSAAHSQALNANQKAYAAWWLWSTLAGWQPETSDDTGDDNGESEGDVGDDNGSGGGCFINTLLIR